MNAPPRKKCLLITYVAPRAPGGGGEVRAFHLVRTATQTFDVTLLNLGGISGAGTTPDALRSLCERVIEPSSEPMQNETISPRGRLRSWVQFFFACTFPWLDHYRPFLKLVIQHATTSRTKGLNGPSIILRRALDIWSRMLPIPPMTCFMFDSSWRKIEQSARQLISRETFDVVWIEHTLTWPYFERLFPNRSPRFVICSSHNVEQVVSQRLERTLQASPYLDYYAAQTRLMQKMELRAWNRSDLIIQCSEFDAEITQSTVPAKRVVVIPNGVDTNYFQRSTSVPSSGSPTILFTAGFGYHPNIEAVEWFLDKVFPNLLSKFPDCRFVFAGSEAKSLYQKLKSSLSSIDQSVECISDPPDIRPCFEKAWVYIVPLLYGGGTRLKILEAMSMRVPVVSTNAGAEGVPYEHGKHLLLADSPDDFVQAIAKLLNNSKLRIDMSATAAEFVRKNYDWQQLCQKTSTALRESCT